MARFLYFLPAEGEVSEALLESSQGSRMVLVAAGLPPNRKLLVASPWTLAFFGRRCFPLPLAWCLSGSPPQEKVSIPCVSSFPLFHPETPSGLLHFSGHSSLPMVC